MSIVRVRRGATSWSSSSVMTTVLPSSMSKARPISSNATSLSSSAQNRRVSIRAPSGSWSWLKRRLWSRTALNITTGTLTRPNESEPDQIGRGTAQPFFPARLASSAAIRSGVSSGGFSFALRGFLPDALRSIISSTASR